MKIVFATNNQNKIDEVQNALPNIELVSLKSIGCTETLAEEQDTLNGNAQQKAEYVFNKFGLPCFADDTGLLIDALNGAPGVYSARYAGEECDSEKNMDLVLEKLNNQENRSARFETVICLFNQSGPTFFNGVAEGNILKERQGGKGFGYDPIFSPTGFEESFAEMTMDQKNEISHRGKAVRELVKALLK
jgi:XTP/dITP diphosphohydrolase|tara:strand:+ start:747 stop:1316 length:570 start_codon:yes stop_codon:yes gene_type:complete